ncbi:MAG: hydrogenase/urease maturation nickel metallochaperone HypA [Candidatus Methanoplasma sp.]|nr:hydrogenase/urease maturation nickel metallochaperone HypA [Candidatus Methanoplasma sp.]
MHEVAVVSDLVSSILEELKKYNVKSVPEVTLVIGKLTNLGHEQIEFAYGVITRDSVLEGSSLVIEEEPVCVNCAECGYDGPAGLIDLGYGEEHSVPLLSCPECKGPVTVVSGRSCFVKCLDIVEED